MLQPQNESACPSAVVHNKESDISTASPLVKQQKRMRTLLDFYRSDPENQHCADCNVHLQESVWVSSSLGVFLCIQCAGLHRKLGVYFSRIKSLHLDAWSEMEIQQVIDFGGNRKVNAGYELMDKTRDNRCSDFDPRSLTDDCNRLRWIQMKYQLASLVEQDEFRTEDSAGMTFWSRETAGSLKSTEDNLRENLAAETCSSTNKKRFVNHFIVVGGRPSHLKEEECAYVPVVEDIFPEESMVEDEFLLSHIPQFAFPEGYHFRDTYKSPTSFSFVLTNINGVKLYASAFKFYEKLSPLELISLVTKNIDGQLVPNADEMSKGGGFPNPEPGYRPKCIMILSHYPYFTTFQEFLRQIYRVTLSEAPLPLERYITNFVSEIPVPPRGRVQVQITLPEDIYTIYRPPRNTFSLVDYSFRPLFRLLDINNALIVFTCIILEHKVVLCSKHISLLTPIAETFLSLLFPFSWQGVYIPLLPLSMWDMIEAPVPFLVGTHASMLKERSSRMRGIFFVDLDHNRVIPALDKDDVAIALPKLPDREAKKLRTKILAHGNIFNPFASDVNKADQAFANEEDIIPIDGFVIEEGHMMSYNRPHAQVNSGPSFSISSQPIRKNMRSREVAPHSPVYPSARASSPAFKSQLPSPSSVDFKTDQLRHRSFQRASRASTSTSFHGDAPNLCVMTPSTSPKSLNSQENIWSADSLTDSSFNETQTFSAHGIRKSFLRFFVSMLRKYPQYLRSQDEVSDNQALFDEDGFLHEITDSGTRAFLSQLLSTQMFQRFCLDRANNAKSSEVLFFDQSIHEKLNRSLTIGKKKYDCSFLADTSEEIQETFVAPSPSSFGLADGTSYKYNYFPKLKKNLFGSVRKPRNLCITLQIHQSCFFRPRTNKCLSWEEIRKSIILLQSFYRMYRQRKRYLRQIIAIRTLQGYIIRRTKARRKRMCYALARTAVMKIQATSRMRSQRRAWAVKCHAIVILQSLIRRFLLRSRLHKICVGIRRFQAVWRGQMTRRKLQHYTIWCVKLQSRFRGCIARRQSQRELVQLFQEARARIINFWEDRNVSIYYRAKFWRLFDLPNYFNLNIFLEEEKRMQKDKQSSTVMKSESVDQSSVRKSGFTLPFTMWNIIRSPTSAQEHDNSVSDACVLNNQEERHLLCQNLKRRCSPEKLNSFYEGFEIALNSKRRKQKLTSLLWRTYKKATLSAEIVANGAADLAHYRTISIVVEHIKETRCRKDLAAIAIASFKSIQKTCNGD